MTDAEAIRTVFPRSTLKSLAIALGSPIDSARHWLYRGMSPDRRKRVALTLLAHWDEEDRRRAACRQQLEAMVQEHDEVGGAGGSAGVTEAGRLASGPKAC